MDHIISMDNQNLILNHLSMQIFEGEIYGILCLENHGIEQMVELICCNRPIQYGQVFFKEELVNSKEGNGPRRNQVALIGRESRLINDLTLADNLFVIRSRFKKFVVPKRILQEQTLRILSTLNIQIEPSILVKELKNFERLIVEIMQAMVKGSRLIILFNISDMLNSEELSRFHHLIHELTQKGYTFLYIYNHHEVLETICDRIAVFKDGHIEKVIESPAEEIAKAIRIFARDSHEKMVTFGAREENDAKKIKSIVELEKVELENIRDLSFSIHSGETVLLLDHSNRILDELMELFGQIRKPVSGNLKVFNEECGRKGRIGLIQRDPTRSMLFWEMSFWDNLCFSLMHKVPFFWQKRHLQENVISEFRKDLGNLLDEPDLYNLSTKDLYTLVYYRYLISKPSLVVCLQPLSGEDVYLRTHILQLMGKLRNCGIAVLILNTELYDTLYLVDRLIQVKQGRVISEHTRSDFDEVKMTNGIFSID